MMTLSDLCAWLAPKAPAGWLIVPGPYFDTYPRGKFIAVTPSPGPGLTLELAYEDVGYQLRTVGRQARGEPDKAAKSEEAQAIAQTMDRVVLGAVVPPTYPTTIGTSRVLYATRTGGGPNPLITDPAGRTHYVASYLFRVSTGL